MDLDAILFVQKQLRLLDVNTKDILLLTSFITNGNIDIDRSINEMLSDCAVEENDMDILNFMELDFRFNVPLYLVLACYKEVSNVLVSVVKSHSLSKETYRDLIEKLIESIPSLETLEKGRILTLIIDLVSAHGKVDIDYFQESVIIREFVKDNLNTLSLQKNKRLVDDQLMKKLTIIKLFSQGFVRYGNVGDININYDEVIIPLVKAKNYRQARLVINFQVLPVDEIPTEGIEVIVDLLEEFKEKESSVDVLEINRLISEIKPLVEPGVMKRKLSNVDM